MKSYKIDIDFSFEHPLPGIYAGEAQWDEACYEAVIWFDPGEPVTWECPGDPGGWTDLEDVRQVHPNLEQSIILDIAKGPDVSHLVREVGLCPWWSALESAADDAVEDIPVPSSHRFYW